MAMNCFPRASMFLGGPLGSAQFVMTVSFARVYFHCHYIGDVIVGILVGCLVGIMVYTLGIRKTLKTIYLNIIGLPVVDNGDYFSDEF